MSAKKQESETVLHFRFRVDLRVDDGPDVQVDEYYYHDESMWRVAYVAYDHWKNGHKKRHAYLLPTCDWDELQKTFDHWEDSKSRPSCEGQRDLPFNHKEPRHEDQVTDLPGG